MLTNCRRMVAAWLLIAGVSCRPGSDGSDGQRIDAGSASSVDAAAAFRPDGPAHDAAVLAHDAAILGGDAPTAGSSPTDTADGPRPDATSPGDATEPEPALSGDPLCIEDGWCWVRPFPQGNSLNTMLATPTGRFWAAGGKGTVIHGDGERWVAVTTGVRTDWRGSWLASDGSYWVVGDAGAVARRARGTWERLDAGTTENLEGVWGAGPNAVWIVGRKGAVLFWDGQRLTRLTPPMIGSRDLFSIWGSSGSDIWIGGAAGGLFHFDGSTWTAPGAPTAYPVVSLWGSDSTNVWAADDGQYAHHLDGPSWKRVIGPKPSRVTGTGPDDVWVLGSLGASHWNGQRWDIMDLRGDVIRTPESMVSRSRNDVWMSASGELLQFDGRALRDRARSLEMNIVYAAGNSSDLWLFDGKLYAHWDGQTFTSESPASIGFPTGGWVAPNGDVWVVAANRIYLRKQGQTQWVNHAPGGATDIWMAVWGAGPNDVWVGGGSGDLAHFDGTRWTAMKAPAAIRVLSLGGTATNDVWAAGWSETALHWNGQQWSATQLMKKPRPSDFESSLGHILATAPDDVWLIGGRVFHFNGNVWDEDLEAPSLVRYAGTKGDIWAAKDSQLWRYQNKTWTKSELAVEGLRSIIGTPRDMWITTNRGVLRRLR